jgi:hypothetical protein
MHLHGGFGNADIASNLFAKAAVRDREFLVRNTFV